MRPVQKKNTGVMQAIAASEPGQEVNVMVNSKPNDQITFEILEHIGVISEHGNGWRRECNIVAWNGGRPKVDIREWSEDHMKMSRGIRFAESEGEMLYKILAKRYSATE